jgi:hypothetical protein
MSFYIVIIYMHTTSFVNGSIILNCLRKKTHKMFGLVEKFVFFRCRVYFGIRIGSIVTRPRGQTQLQNQLLGRGLAAELVSSSIIDKSVQ